MTPKLILLSMNRKSSNKKISKKRLKALNWGLTQSSKLNSLDRIGSGVRLLFGLIFTVFRNCLITNFSLAMGFFLKWAIQFHFKGWWTVTPLCHSAVSLFFFKTIFVVTVQTGYWFVEPSLLTKLLFNVNRATLSRMIPIPVESVRQFLSVEEFVVMWLFSGRALSFQLLSSPSIYMQAKQRGVQHPNPKVSCL